jgi:putative redox protein
MEMVIDFPGGAKVDAHFDGFTVSTDQPKAGGGQDSAPTPFQLFLASLGTCAGIYVLNFLQQRQLPTEGLKLIERVERDPATGMVVQVELEIQIPPGIPPQYQEALIRTASLCTVKKHLEHPPQFKLQVTSLPVN